MALPDGGWHFHSARRRDSVQPNRQHHTQPQANSRTPTPPPEHETPENARTSGITPVCASPRATFCSPAESAEGTKAFADILENGSPGSLGDESLPKLIKALLKEGSRESKDAARLIFKNKRYTEIHYGWVRASLVRPCAEAGIGDGYLSYIPLLDIKSNSIGNVSYSNDTVVGELIATEIIDSLAPKDKVIIRIKKEFPKPADQIAPLKEWLRAKAKSPAL